MSSQRAARGVGRARYLRGGAQNHAVRHRDTPSSCSFRRNASSRLLKKCAISRRMEAVIGCSVTVPSCRTRRPRSSAMAASHLAISRSHEAMLSITTSSDDRIGQRQHQKRQDQNAQPVQNTVDNPAFLPATTAASAPPPCPQAHQQARWRATSPTRCPNHPEPAQAHAQLD